MNKQVFDSTVEQNIYYYSISTPDKIAVICNLQKITYKELWNSILSRKHQLKEKGLLPHRPFVFKSTQDISFLITYFAIHLCEAIAVPLGKDVTDDIFESINKEVNSYQYENDIVDILYTTGTTGKAKGVKLSKDCLLACSENFICNLQFSSDLLFIVSGPLNHIASLFKIHPTLSSGATLFILDGIKDMNSFFDIFSLPFPKFATFLVPASIRLLLQFAFDKLSALSEKIAFIETGAAPITKADMKRLCEALPKSRLYNTYGGTEIGCVCTYNFNDGKYLEGCVGKPMKNATVDITENGNIIVSGKTIMSGYVADNVSTDKVLKDGHIYGSDLGYLDENGMLFLTGRSGDVINVGGYKIDPVEVENAALSYPSIKDCICIVAQHPIIGNVLKLLYVSINEETIDRHNLAVYLKSQLDSYKVPLYYESVHSINRTYNGKLDRKSYK